MPSPQDAARRARANGTERNFTPELDMDGPRVWTKAEVIGMIAEEFKLTKQECRSLGAPFGPQEIAEAIYAVLSDNSLLIELGP